MPSTDYNIYIHADGSGSGGGSDKKTKPKQTLTDGEKKAQKFTKTVSKVGSFIQNPDSALGGGIMGVAVKTKNPYIIAVAAVATVTFGIADKAITMHNQFASIYSGSTYNITKYNNFKQGIKNLFTPISTHVESEKKLAQIRVDNARNEQQMLLTGGTIVNSQYGRYL